MLHPVTDTARDVITMQYQIQLRFKKPLKEYHCKKAGNKTRFQIVNRGKANITSVKRDDKSFIINFNSDVYDGLELASNLDKSLQKMHSYKSLSIAKVGS